MNGKELIRKAFQCETTERAPWVPFVGAHAGSLLGVSAEELLRCEDHLVRGVQAAIERYQPDGIPVAFDLQLEAEALGCELKWSADNPPSVVQHPLTSGKRLEDLHIPKADEGRIGVVMRATKRLREANPELALYGLVTGPFTLALHLQGTDIFMRMFDEPESVKRLMEFARDVAIAMANYYREVGCDVIAIVDPMTSQISPKQFEEFVTPYARPVFKHIADLGLLSSFFVCGHAQQNIRAMCACGPNNISVDENIPLDFVRDVCLENNVSFGGNLQLTTVLLLGTVDDAERNAVECLDVGGRMGFVLAPGCDLPYATPPANLEAIGRIARDPYRQQIVRTTAQQRAAGDILDMSEYGHADKVIVDIITLDSEACTPCRYMVEAVRKVTPEFEGIVEWREHKIKHQESLVFMTSLFVKNVPTICIDGRITFVSQIPPRHELIAAIQKRINEKMRQRIQQRQASIYILGTDREACATIQENTERAIRELGVDLPVWLVNDEKEIRFFGVYPAQTPAVVVARYQLKSTRSIPETPIIKEWIKAVL